MHTKLPPVVLILTTGILVLALAGCAGPKAPAPVAGVEQAPPPESVTAPAPDAAPEDGTKAAKQAIADERERDKHQEEDASDALKLVRLERDLDAAQERLTRARMKQAHAAAQQQASLARAEKDLALSRRKLSKFNERSAPNRIEWARLRLKQAQDRVKEAGEELQQLELLYKEEEFADQTKDIVLERSRRRLERSQRDLELRQEDFTILTELTIPIERSELELAVTSKERALEKARAAAEASELDRAMDLRGAENGVTKVEEDIKAHREKVAGRQRERERKTREKALDDAKQDKE